jgi:N-acetyl sugar amidotransferase
MDTSDPFIQFDSDGVCSHCREFDRQAELFVGNESTQEQRLERLLGRIRRTRREGRYDCVIGVSGGVDSSYVAHLAKKVFDLRPLAVHVDNGWNSNLAVSNIHHLVNKLEIDLITEVLDWREFKSLQLAFLRSSTPDLEIPTDHAITATLMRVAREHRIRFILGGSNVASEGIMPAAWSQGIRDYKYISAVNSRFGSMELKSFPHFTYYRFAFNKLLGQRWIDILNYVRFEKAEAVQLLVNEYDWEPYSTKHGESIYTRFFQNFYLPTKFGADKRRGHLSSLICSGQIDRTAALEVLAHPIAPQEEVSADVEYVRKKFELSESEFFDLLDSPPRTMTDFPNYEQTWAFKCARLIYRVGRNLGFRIRS